MELLPYDQLIIRIVGSQKRTWRNRSFLDCKIVLLPVSIQAFLDKYRCLVSSYEGKRGTTLEYCDPLNDVGDHSNDTTTDEPIPNHVEQTTLINLESLSVKYSVEGMLDNRD